MLVHHLKKVLQVYEIIVVVEMFLINRYPEQVWRACWTDYTDMACAMNYLLFNF